MVRPVSAWQYLASKYIAQLCILLVALGASYILTWYYTNILFEAVPWTLMLASLAVYSLWIVFTCCGYTLCWNVVTEQWRNRWSEYHVFGSH